VSKSALTCAPLRGGWEHRPPEPFFFILGHLRWVLVQSESVELRILLSWSDELTIYSSVSSSL